MPRTRKQIKRDMINTIIKEEYEDEETKFLREQIQFLKGLLNIKNEAMKKCLEGLKMQRLLYSEVEFKSIMKELKASRSKKVNYYSIPLNLFKGTAFSPITPKVKPNMPAIMLRKPVQGETVLSMQGSPLLVATNQNENQATVNVPLRDGRVFSIQAERGLRLSQLPSLEEDTQYQLEILRQNLNRICSSIQK